MATSLARLSSCTPALRAFSAASFWNNIANVDVDSTLHHTCCTKQEDVTVPVAGISVALGRRSAHRARSAVGKGVHCIILDPLAWPAPEATPQRPPNDATYFGPLSQQHKLLKRISIANTLVAAAAAPAIVALADSISMTGRYGLAASLGFFGIITTGALHWVAHPYVHELRYTAATGQLDVRTTTLLGNSRWHSFNVDDVRPLPWSRPVATFTALGQFYYIDVYDFPDEQLLRRLTPDEADVPPGYKDKDDDDD